MNNRNCTLLALALLKLAVATTQTQAQTTYTSYTFTTLAGNAGYGSADGTGIAARFNNPSGVAVDSVGNVYVADRDNNTIRKVTPVGTNWVVTTLAGLAGVSGTNDGTGIVARFNGPSGVAVDSADNVYVADAGNNTVRKVTPTGMVTTLTGLAGVSGTNDGTGSGALFNGPSGVAVDTNGNAYVADTYNFTIRKVTPVGTNWVVTTLAGSAGQIGSDDGTGSAARFGGPFEGIGGPTGVAVDTNGNVYVADTFNFTIRKVTPAGVVTTLAGLTGYSGSDDGTNSGAQFYHPYGVAVDSTGNIYVADTDNYTIRKVAPVGTNWMVTTLAGLAGSYGSVDGTGSAARFGEQYAGPRGVGVDSAGNVYVADTGNSTTRKVTPAGVVTALAGLAGGGYGSVDGTGSAARFNFPDGVAVDTNGNVYVADYYNSMIRKVTPAGVVTTLAGLAGVSGTNNGTGSAARFAYPYGVAADSASNVFVADTYNSAIRKLTLIGTNWVVTTLAGLGASAGTNDGTGSAARFAYPYGVAVDTNGNVYVADTDNHTIRKVTPVGTNWVVTTLAGLAHVSGTNDGTGSAARFYNPVGVAADGAGNVYVGDRLNTSIRKVTSAGVVTTLAGGSYGSADGTGSAAQFNEPFGVAVDNADNLYVADSYNNTIRKVTPAGVVTTLAGLAGGVGSADGSGSAVRFNFPEGVTVDSAGNVYVADSGNNTIRKGTPLALSALLYFDTTVSSLTISNGLFQMRLIGPSGSNVVVEASANLSAWTPVQTNTLPPAGLSVSVPLDTNQNQFFRAHLTP